MPAKPTIRDVAQVADVAVGTVSNVLNRPDRVDSDLRRRVQSAIAELHFVPDETARRLRTSPRGEGDASRGTRARHVGPVVDETTLRILRALADGATAAEAARRCHVADSTLRRKLALLREEWAVETNMQVVVMSVRRGLI